MKCNLYLRDCVVLTKDFELKNHQSIAIDGSRIVAMGPSCDLDGQYEPVETIPGRGKLAMPGFIDGHTHTSQQLLRGRISDEYPVIYRRFNLPYESKLTADDIELCTQLSCLEMIKSGITAFADAGSTHMPAMIAAVEAAGLRAAITRSTSDRGADLPPNMYDSTDEALRQSEQLFTTYDGAGDGRIRIWFQFRSLTTCSDELIQQLAEAARHHETGLHAHVAEYPESILHALNCSGLREIAYLERLGALGPNLLAAHCILLSDGDIRMLQEHDVKVVHSPRSNLGKGITKTPQMLGAGLSVGLGTDGTAHSGLSMFKEITAFKHAQIAAWGAPYGDSAVMPARTLIEMATLGSARALQIDRIAGTLEVGKKADIILVDVDQPHLTPTHDLLNSLVEAGETADVKDMIVDGRVLMRDREVKVLDEKRLLSEGNRRIATLARENGWRCAYPASEDGAE